MLHSKSLLYLSGSKFKKHNMNDDKAVIILWKTCILATYFTIYISSRNLFSRYNSSISAYPVIEFSPIIVITYNFTKFLKRFLRLLCITVDGNHTWKNKKGPWKRRRRGIIRAKASVVKVIRRGRNIRWSNKDLIPEYLHKTHAVLLYGFTSFPRFPNNRL